MSGIKKLKQKVLEDKLKSAMSDPEARVQTGEPLDTQDVPGGRPVEAPAIETDTLNMMYAKAVENAANADEDGHKVKISPVEVISDDTDSVRWFSIIDESGNGSNDYAIYQIRDTVCYRPLKEFLQIVNDIRDKVPGITVDSLKFRRDRVKEPIETSYNVKDRDDCAFVISSIISSMTGKSYDNVLITDRYVSESCKIRKNNKIGTDYKLSKSVLAHEAKYGTPEKNAFKQEIEDKQKKDGTVGALDQQQQESAGVKIPNVHRKMVSESIIGVDIDALFETKGDEIYYEPFDRVIAKIDGVEQPARVTAVYDDVDGRQLITVIAGGRTFNLKATDMKPDMTYLFNRLMDTTDEFADIAFDIDPETRMPRKLSNDKKDYSKDYKNLNEWVVSCDIVHNGFKCNYDKCFLSVRDIAESSRYVRVINESGEVDMWPIDAVSVSPDNWPYAVICRPEDEDNEPVRKIRINPNSYVEAPEDGLVDCLLGDEMTQIEKRFIKIIS